MCMEHCEVFVEKRPKKNEEGEYSFTSYYYTINTYHCTVSDSKNETECMKKFHPAHKKAQNLKFGVLTVVLLILAIVYGVLKITNPEALEAMGFGNPEALEAMESNAEDLED